MPRATPPTVDWRQTPRWPSPQAFWAESMTTDDVTSLADKYAALLDMIAMRPGVERERGLRALAARWPGVLREGQLAPVSSLRARALALGRLGAVDRARWLDEGLAAVPLWAELHRLLGDLSGLRAVGGDPAALPGHLDGPMRGRWPSDPAWWAAQPWPPGAQFPRSWLAAVAGVTPTELDTMLRG